MGHSAEYQTELYIKQLEQMAQTLVEQGQQFSKGGLDDLARSTHEQAEKLKRAIDQLRSVME